MYFLSTYNLVVSLPVMVASIDNHWLDLLMNRVSKWSSFNSLMASNLLPSLQWENLPHQEFGYPKIWESKDKCLNFFFYLTNFQISWFLSILKNDQWAFHFYCSLVYYELLSRFKYIWFNTLQFLALLIIKLSQMNEL